MLSFVEFSLARPTPLRSGFDLRHHLRGATARIFEPGDREDITSPLWNNQTHRWLLNVRSDNVGVLTIKPVAKIAFITVFSSKAKLAQLSEITHTLREPAKHLLMGTQIHHGREARVATIFKAVCALTDDDPLMRWVMDSGPRKISR